MNKYYGGVIWTNHVIGRLKERGIKQGDAWATWKRPDNTRYAESRGGWVYERVFGNKKIEVVAKETDKGEWLILSVWSKPIVHRYPKHTFSQKYKDLIQKVLKFFNLG